MRTRLLLIVVSLASAGCVSIPAERGTFCESSQFLVDAQFEGGNFYHCVATDTSEFKINIHPEDRPPINESPWYAFRVSPKVPGEITVTVQFTDGYARYWPKISRDGVNWHAAEESEVKLSVDGRAMTLSATLDETSIWIAGQELITNTYFDVWVRELAQRDDIQSSLLGRSVQGRPITVSRTEYKPEIVLLLGRQHPPEVTGTIAMRKFVNELLGDSALARQFRERYAVIVIPLINPDGVALGHWRHNVNGVDLNRDWGPFTQPETQSVARLLNELEQSDMKIQLMLDFHSTQTTRFYTQLPEDTVGSTDFATAWLTRAKMRLPNFEFVHDARQVSEQANSKNYFFKTYGIPAITYELGDETDRDAIVSVTPVFAEEMMRSMLERPIPSPLRGEG